MISINKTIKNIFIDSRNGIIIAVLVTLFFCISGFIINRAIDHQLSREFNIVANNTLENINQEFNYYSNIIFSTRGLFAASDFVDRHEWSEFIISQNIHINYPAVRALEYAEIVNDNDIEDFILRVRDEGFDNFNIIGNSNLDKYAIVNYIEPMTGNEAVFGFDLFSETDRNITLSAARDTNSLFLTPPILLIQDNRKVPSLLSTLPIYKNGLSIETLEDRRNNVQGFVISVIDSNEILSAISNSFNNTILFSLSDDGNEFFNNYQKNTDIIEKFVFFDRIEIGGRVWIFKAYPSSSFISSFTIYRILLLTYVLAGILFAVLVFIILLLVNRSKRLAEALAQDMTNNFNREKDKLTKANKDLKMVNDAMIGRELKMIELKNKIKELSNTKIKK